MNIENHTRDYGRMRAINWIFYFLQGRILKIQYTADQYHVIDIVRLFGL